MADSITKLEKLQLAIQLHRTYFANAANSFVALSANQLATGLPDVATATAQLDECLEIVDAFVCKHR